MRRKVDNYLDIAIKLIQKRRALKLTQGEMAKLMGVGRGVYAYWEQGATPRTRHLLQVCEVLEITPNELFLREG